MHSGSSGDEVWNGQPLPLKKNIALSDVPLRVGIDDGLRLPEIQNSADKKRSNNNIFLQTNEKPKLPRLVPNLQFILPAIGAPPRFHNILQSGRGAVPAEHIPEGVDIV